MAAGKEAYEIRSFFEHGGVLNCRPAPGSACRMAVSLKGGYNAEPHNHNDKGTFVVAVGRESLILDPGGEVYTARTFSKDRYKSNLLNSFGHPVPVVAGKLQRPGKDAKAILVSHNFTDAADTLAMDLRSVYEVKELKTLTRTFVYTRTGEGSLTVTDDFAFSTPQTFGSALITYGRWKKLSARELLISAGREAVTGFHRHARRAVRSRGRNDQGRESWQDAAHAHRDQLDRPAGEGPRGLHDRAARQGLLSSMVP